jgi:enediyne biosynthesis protein E3
MSYIGVGWACARLPRWRWHAVLPADPVLGWLVLDGYGFHQAYFHTRRYVHEMQVDRFIGARFGRPAGHADRVVDQGIGRALWFVEGTDVQRVADRIGTFPEHRRADLWSGAALAATYAGGAGEPELARFWTVAEKYRPNVAQGCAFAAEARLMADLVTEHTALATAAFCAMTPQQAAAVVRLARIGLPPDSSESAYAVWRERITERFLSAGRG